MKKKRQWKRLRRWKLQWQRKDQKTPQKNIFYAATWLHMVLPRPPNEDIAWFESIQIPYSVVQTCCQLQNHHRHGSRFHPVLLRSIVHCNQEIWFHSLVLRSDVFQLEKLAFSKEEQVCSARKMVNFLEKQILDKKDILWNMIPEIWFSGPDKYNLKVYLLLGLPLLLAHIS